MTSTPFDLDALEAEATATTFEFTLKGEHFELPAAAGLDYRVALDGEYNDNGTPTVGEMRRVLRLAMGEDQWERFDVLPLSIAGLNAVFAQWYASMGVDPGEGDASPSS
ncbi:MAG: hypothetical protein AB7I38_14455 [Dehalococcoidia bacterium]